MKALAFATIAITLSYIGVVFAQDPCNIDENDAHNPDTTTWDHLKYHLITKYDPDRKHWHRREAKYRINEDSAPQAAPGAITAAHATWNSATWHNGVASDFGFTCEGDTRRHADKKDGKNVVSFKGYRSSGGHNSVARTYLRQTHWGRPDRLKEVDTILNKRKYWATGAQANHYDIQTVMTHEFGHWLAANDLYPLGHQEDGCDEFTAALMYYSRTSGIVKRDLHWIDKWAKWYLYTSGDVPMAPSVMEFPPAVQHAADNALQTRLLQNYPAPFNPETWIPYELAYDSNVSIDIYDSSGGLVRTLEVGDKPRGRYIERSKAVHWDGKDDNGASVASGVYFYTLRADGISHTQRLVVIK